MKQKKKEGKKEIKKGNQNTQQLGRSGSKRTLNQKSACLFSFGWSTDFCIKLQLPNKSHCRKFNAFRTILKANRATIFIIFLLRAD